MAFSLFQFYWTADEAEAREKMVELFRTWPVPTTT